MAKAKRKKQPKKQKAPESQKPASRKGPKPAAQNAPKTPKMLKPLEILYLLKIPGLPNGDFIAICLAKGAAQ